MGGERRQMMRRGGGETLKVDAAGSAVAFRREERGRDFVRQESCDGQVESHPFTHSCMCAATSPRREGFTLTGLCDGQF